MRKTVRYQLACNAGANCFKYLARSCGQTENALYCYLDCWYLISMACQTNAMITLVILSLSGVLLFELSSSRVDGCACPGNDVLIRNQTELDRYLDDEISYRRKNNATRCIQWILTGRSYQLDMVELMKINLQQSDSLIIQGHNGNMVDVNCVGGPANMEELFKTVQPLHSSLLILDSLTFVECPVPLLIEEVSKVLISNCIFQ